MKAAISIILVVTQTTQSRANTSMNVRIVPEQALLACMVEIRPVVDRSLVARRSTEHLWSPGIQMGIEMDDGDRAVGAVHAAEQRERDSMVSAESDETWQCLAL